MYVNYVTSFNDYSIEDKLPKEFVDIFREKLEKSTWVERVKVPQVKFRKNKNLEIHTWWPC